MYSDFAWLGLNIRSDILAPKGDSGRARIFRAMQKYYENDGPRTASTFVQVRHNIHKGHGLAQTDIDQFELGISFALVANSAAAMFWVIYYAYSLPEMLDEIRNEVLSVRSIGQQLESRTESRASDNSAVNSNPPVIVNVAEVVEKCVLLTSFINEILRVQSTSASARVVMEDTVLDGKYLLKKDNFVLSPSAVMHKDENAWGPTAGQLDPRRFISQQQDQFDEQGKRRRQHKAPLSAHRTWGGGVNHCPGQHFATHEFISVLVVMILRYDAVPSTGTWEFPKTIGHLAASITQPVKDVEVVIKQRKDVPCWEFVWRA